MHAMNTELQNTEISDGLARIEKLYNRAIRRPNPERCRLSEGLGEVLWKSRNWEYKDAIALLRHAEAMFLMVIEAESVADAMQDFSVRPDEVRLFEVVPLPRSRLKNMRIPRDAVLLVPSRRGAPRQFAMAA